MAKILGSCKRVILVEPASLKVWPLSPSLCFPEYWTKTFQSKGSLFCYQIIFLNFNYVFICVWVHVCCVCAHANLSVYSGRQRPAWGSYISTSTRFLGLKPRVLGTMASIYPLNHLTGSQIKFTLKRIFLKKIQAKELILKDVHWGIIYKQEQTQVRPPRCPAVKDWVIDCLSVH